MLFIISFRRINNISFTDYKFKKTLSKKAQILPASPIRKLVPYADAAKKRGITVYHLNIGQPDIESPDVALKAVKDNTLKLVAYPNSAGNESYRKGLARYYQNIGIDVDYTDINVTTGGSEALQIALTVTCDPDDEVIVLEPFYTNYNSFAIVNDVKFVPITTSIDNGFARVSSSATPATPPESSTPGTR